MRWKNLSSFAHQHIWLSCMTVFHKIMTNLLCGHGFIRLSTDMGKINKNGKACKKVSASIKKG